MIDYVLKFSLEQEIIVTIIYLKGSVITKRNIQALEIGDNTIKAYCYLRQQNRIFKRDNILSASFCKSRANV